MVREKVNFRVETEGTDTWAVTELPSEGIRDTVGIGMMLNNRIPGLASLSLVRMDNREYLRYNISSNISMERLFSGRTEKKKFLSVIRNIIHTIRSIEDYMMEPSCLLLGKNDIYVNVGNMKTTLIYYPVMQKEGEFHLTEFLKELIMNMEFSMGEDNGYVAQLINYLNRTNAPTPEEIENKVTEMMEGTGNSVMPAAQPVPLQSAPMQHVPAQTVPVQTPPPQSVQPPVAVPPVPPVNTVPAEQESKGKKRKFSLFGNSGSEEKKGKKKKEPAPVTPQGIMIPGMDKSGMAAMPEPPKPGGAARLGDIPAKPTTVRETPAPAYVPAAGETSVLGIGQAGETTVLSAGGGNSANPVLLRKRTGERITISKDIFRLGSERTYADYCITGNNAVSRSHADIICQGGRYYIVDNNSLNHTYINDRQIPSQQPVILEEFARIRLADELFEFCSN